MPPIALASSLRVTPRYLNQIIDIIPVLRIAPNVANSQLLRSATMPQEFAAPIRMRSLGSEMHHTHAPALCLLAQRQRAAALIYRPFDSDPAERRTRLHRLSPPRPKLIKKLNNQ
jgi:hypothetical protein